MIRLIAASPLLIASTISASVSKTVGDRLFNLGAKVAGSTLTTRRSS